MAKYNKVKIFKKAKEEAEKRKLLFIEEIVSYLPISKPTFYDYFKDGSDELNEIKEILENNKVQIKNGLRKKWYDNDNATTQLALYRLTSTPEEHRLLNQSYIDQTSKGDKIDNKFEILIVNPNEDNQQENK